MNAAATPKTNFALMGLGNMGRHHARVLNDDPHSSLVAILEPDMAHKELPAGYAGQVCHDLPTFWNHDFSAVVVATPTETHHELVKAALRRGKHVLVEKPTASTWAEAQELVQLAQQLGCHLAVGHIERCNPAVTAMRSVLQQGLIGEPYYYRSERCGPYPNAVKPGNQVFLDLAVHEIDVLQHLAGPLSLSSSYHHCLLSSGLPDLAQMELTLASGARCSIHVNWLSPQKSRLLTVYGAYATAQCDYQSQTLTIFGKDLDHLKSLDGYGKFIPHPHCQAFAVAITRQEPLRKQLAEFARLLAGSEHGMCAGNDTLLTMQILDDCHNRSLNLPNPGEFNAIPITH